MHHPKEAVIDGVKFVLVREEVLDGMIKALRKAETCFKWLQDGAIPVGGEIIVKEALEAIKTHHPEYNK